MSGKQLSIKPIRGLTGSVNENKDTVTLGLSAGSAYGQGMIWNGTAYIPSPDPAAMITYVSPDGTDNPLAGYDANHPVKTIAYALTLASSRKRATQKRIKLLPGTYPESIDIRNDAHKGSFFHIFADTLGTVTVGGQAWDGESDRTETVMAGCCALKMSNLVIKPKTGTGGGQIVYSVDGAYVSVGICVIDASNAASPMIALHANTGGFLVTSSTTTIRGNLHHLLYASALGSVLANGLTLDGDIAFSGALAAVSNGRMHIVNAITNTGTLSGGKRFAVDVNGDLGGSSRIPTSSLAAGTVSTGGRAN